MKTQSRASSSHTREHGKESEVGKRMRRRNSIYPQRGRLRSHAYAFIPCNNLMRPASEVLYFLVFICGSAWRTPSPSSLSSSPCGIRPSACWRHARLGAEMFSQGNLMLFSLQLQVRLYCAGKLVATPQPSSSFSVAVCGWSGRHMYGRVSSRSCLGTNLAVSSDRALNTCRHQYKRTYVTLLCRIKAGCMYSPPTSLPG